MDGEFSEEVYFIKTGNVKIYAKNGFSFGKFVDGQHFGEAEVMHKIPREGKAVAETDCVLYSLHKD